MKPETVIIILPLPPRCLSPNRPPGSRGGRIRKAASAKKYRRLAKEAAESCGVESGPWPRATVRALFFHKTKRRRDDVNFLAMLKPAYDGLVDGGLIEDDSADHLTTLGASFDTDKGWPRVELMIERVE